MSEARDRILSAIRRSLGRGPLSGDQRAALEARLSSPRPGPIPARARGDHGALVELFKAEAERVQASVVRVRGAGAVAEAVAAYLAENGLPTTLRLAPDPALEGIPWTDGGTLAVSYGPGRDGDSVTVTAAFAGVAETGTLVLLSGPESPTTLNLLADAHIAVLAAERICATYEDAWSWLRARGEPFMPRAVNWITGPSRTADLEQTLLLGAHGPRSLHIIIVEGGDAP